MSARLLWAVALRWGEHRDGLTIERRIARLERRKREVLDECRTAEAGNVAVGLGVLADGLRRVLLDRPAKEHLRG